MSDTQHKSINRTKIDRRIDKHFMQSYWSALQFAPTNLPVFYRGMPQASHGMTVNKVVQMKYNFDASDPPRLHQMTPLSIQISKNF